MSISASTPRAILLAPPERAKSFGAFLRGQGLQVLECQDPEVVEAACAGGWRQETDSPPLLLLLDPRLAGPGFDLGRRLRALPGGEWPLIVALHPGDQAGPGHVAWRALLEAGADECLDGTDELELRLPALERGLKVRAGLRLGSIATSRADALERVLAPQSAAEAAPGPRTLEKALETMQIGVTVSDLSGHIVYVNAADARLHGSTVEELLGRDVGVYSVGGQRSPLTLAQLRSLKSWSRDGWNAKKDGTPFRVRLLSDVVTGPDGEPIGVVTTCEDVSEAWRSRQALEESRAALSALLEATDDAVWSVDTRHQLSAFNGRFRELFRELAGRDPEPGLSLLEHLPEGLRAWWHELSRRGLAGARVTVERALPAGRAERFYELTVSPIRGASQVAGLCVFAHDVTARRRAEQDLRVSEERLAAARGVVDGLWEWDPDTDEARFSPQWKALLGHGEAEVGERVQEWLGRVHPDDEQLVREALAAHLQERAPRLSCEHRLRHRDGSWRYMLARGVAVRDPDGRVMRVAGSLVDVTARRAAEEALRRSEERYALAARAANDGLWDWDLAADSLYFSPRWKQMFGYEEHEVGSSPDEWSMRLHVADRERVKAELQAHLQGTTPQLRSEHRLRHRDGSFRWVLCRAVAERDPAGKAVRLVGAMTDITERKAAEERLLHDAVHDATTGLPNRALFADRVKHGLARCRRHPAHRFAVLSLELERLEWLRETRGPAALEKALREAAARLGPCVRAVDMVGRQGGGEFLVLLDAVAGAEGALQVAERIQKALEAPLAVEGQAFESPVHLGVALGGPGHADAEAVLREAETAMLAARASGGRPRLFDPEMRTRAAAQQELEEQVRRALAEGTLELAYQPVVALVNGRLAGFDACVRFPTARGEAAVEALLASREGAPLAAAVDRWACAAAYRQAAAWAAAPAGPGLRVAVPLSPERPLDATLAEAVEPLRSGAALPPGSLVLEAGVRAVEASPDAEAVAARLRTLGLGLRLSGFGVAPFSLVRLPRLHLDAVRLDRALVAQLEGEGREAVSALLAFARGLGLSAVADGVVHEDQADALRRLGCTHARGPLFGGAVDPAEASSLLGARPAWNVTR